MIKNNHENGIQSLQLKMQDGTLSPMFGSKRLSSELQVDHSRQLRSIKQYVNYFPQNTSYINSVQFLGEKKSVLDSRNIVMKLSFSEGERADESEMKEGEKLLGVHGILDHDDRINALGWLVWEPPTLDLSNAS